MTLSLIRATSDRDLAAVYEVCETRHYLQRYPDPRSLPMAYLLGVDYQWCDEQGLPFGVIVFKHPQHSRQRGLFGYTGLPTCWQVLDMARVWVNPVLQQPGLNVFSQMVSLALRRVQWDWLEHHPPVFPNLPYHIELIISYCELAHHDGTAYRACSFERAGKTTDGTKELYVKRLKPPRKRWTPTEAYQPPLFDFMPLVHG